MPNPTKEEIKMAAALLATLPPQLQTQIISSATDDSSYQSTAADILRQTAIAHLEYGQGIVAQGFRGEYSAVKDRDSYTAFLRQQETSGEWGTYIEATALAERFGVNLVVTCHNDKGKTDTFVLYKTEQDNAPTIHLHNNNNTHWYFPQSGNSTMGNGNCLYNAFAQALLAATKPEVLATQAVTPKPVNAYVPSVFLHAKDAPTPTVNEIPGKENKIIKQQQNIASLLGKALKPSEIEKDLKAEETRIAKLSPAEQEQIRNDYKYALNVAAKEFRDPSSCRLPYHKAIGKNTEQQKAAALDHGDSYHCKISCSA